MYKKYFKTIGLAIIICIVFLYAFQQGASLTYNYWLSMWADDPIVNGTQLDTDLKLGVFGALGFVQGQSEKLLVPRVQIFFSDTLLSNTITLACSGASGPHPLHWCPTNHVITNYQ